MRKWMTLMAGLALILSVGLANASEKKAEKAPAKGKLYEVVDSACYVQKGEHGAAHMACAKKCASAGGELGLLRDGNLYVPVDKDFKSARNKVKDGIGRSVEVTGKTFSKGGVNYLQVEEVTIPKVEKS